MHNHRLSFADAITNNDEGSTHSVLHVSGDLHTFSGTDCSGDDDGAS